MSATAKHSQDDKISLVKQKPLIVLLENVANIIPANDMYDSHDSDSDIEDPNTVLEDIIGSLTTYVSCLLDTVPALEMMKSSIDRKDITAMNETSFPKETRRSSKFIAQCATMADPLSIAASAATVIAMCKTIRSYAVAFTVDLKEVPQVLEDFKMSISSLTSALHHVEDLFKNQPKKLPFAEKEESRHWRDIESVVAACQRSLVRLSNELPDLEADRGRPFDELRKQLTLKLNSDTIAEIRRRQTEYTHTLQLSLVTLSL
jgi:hypothetical protein